MRIAQLREVVDRHGKLARRGAQRKQPFLGAFQELRVELAGPHRRLDGRLRRIERDQAAIDRLDDLVEQARHIGSLALQPAQQAGKLRHRRGRARQDVLRIGDIGRDLLGAHHRGAALGKLGLLARLRIELRRVPRPMRADSRPRAPPPRPSPGGASAPGRRRARASSIPRRRRRAPTCPPNASSRSRCAAGSTSARSSCWPWISTSARPMSRISATLAGWSLTKTRVRPSAVCTRAG